MKKTFLAVLALSVLYIACKPKEPEKPKEQLLKEGKWKISKLELKNIGETQDLLAVMEECNRNNFYFFNADNSITLDEGDTKCFSTDIQVRTDGRWALEQNNSKLVLKESTIFGVKSDQSLDVISISASNIEFSKDTTITLPAPVGLISGKIVGTFSNVK